ncbi:MAG TPA: hydroxyacylglutathione hydrolase [Frateuria sp.]|uniref:hydroxyacylglutathione hydrolase n=1 Tax=Frateuria sp. TaxID=2211372 RepID=UPI002D80593D|nr:hydroxyacylglutathione hydrolase [Frateuria sp.]HET6805254.1 hydroxyacylglutathione hydrolase [Frateuria sp.]
MHVVPLPALADNYIWLLHDDAGHAFVVDPGDAAPVEAALARHSLQLHAILLTHHHGDHVAGAASLRARHGATVYAPRDERIGAVDRRVGDGDVVALERPRARFEVIEVPGHTRSHIAYAGENLLFCGDTLFSLGCGRLFEGTPAQMLASLDRLAALTGDLQVCCGHEYTQANGRFARQVDPANTALATRCDEAARARAEGRPTLPVPLASELACNPFLRIDSEPLTDWARRQHAAGSRVERFAALRAAKDVFQG